MSNHYLDVIYGLNHLHEDVDLVPLSSDLQVVNFISYIYCDRRSPLVDSGAEPSTFNACLGNLELF